MSLINEALKRAEAIGQSTKAPDAKRSTHSVEHLYDDQATDREATSAEVAEEISHILGKGQTSLRGASALGVCVIASVAVIMHLTLPPEQRSPVEAKAGDATATLETQTPAANEETKSAPDKTPEKSTVAALQHALADVLDRSTAKISKTTPLPKPIETVQPKPGERNTGEKPNAGRFTLSGIMASGDKGYAIVNGHMVTVGDNIDGAKVVTIGTHHVVLEREGEQFTLRM